MAAWLGNSCCCPPTPPTPDSQRWLCGQTAPWPGDMFVLVFVTISQIGVGSVPLPPKSGVAGRSSTPGSTTQVCMAPTPLLKRPRPAFQADFVCIVKKCVSHGAGEGNRVKGPHTKHIIPGEKCPHSNLLSSHQSCPGKVGLQLAWLFGRK